MRQVVAKRLRRQAQEQGNFYSGNKKYVQEHQGKTITAMFGRQVIQIVEKFYHTMTTYMPEQEYISTIRCQPHSVRAIYQQLKKEYKEHYGNKHYR